jgi:hypothetical protein
MGVGVFSLLQLGPRIQSWDPILGIGTMRLAARDAGRSCYACRFCHRAQYLSQKQNTATRKRLTAAKLRLAMGGWPDIREPFPPKAKWKHKKRYRRPERAIRTRRLRTSGVDRRRCSVGLPSYLASRIRRRSSYLLIVGVGAQCAPTTPASLRKRTLYSHRTVASR